MSNSAACRSRMVIAAGNGLRRWISPSYPAAFVALETESSLGQYQDSCANQVVTATVTVTLMVEAPDADYDPIRRVA